MTVEPATARVQAWLGGQTPSGLYISDWIVTEFAAALSMKVRTKQLDASERARVSGAFTTLRLNSLTVLPVTRTHLLTAVRFAEQAAIGLRAGDALHVAIAAEAGLTLCTLDKRLASAATALAVSNLLP